MSVVSAFGFFLASAVVLADRGLKIGGLVDDVSADGETFVFSYLLKVVGFLWQADGSYDHHVWPVIPFKFVLLSLILCFFWS